MNILMASSELTPLAHTGGLGDVLEAFPIQLLKRGHKVSLALPFYRCIREDKSIKARPTSITLPVSVGPKRIQAEVFETTLADALHIYLIRRDEYFDRSGLYGADGREYEDNAERFIFFQKAVVELAKKVENKPDVLHCHDWQTGLIPVFAKEAALGVKTVLTIHNLAYQGSFLGVDFGLTNLPGHYFGAKGVEFFGSLNFLKAGIVFADVITTVSERYAHDIQTSEYGCGLENVLREHSRKLRGILNGADYETWNPATDKLIGRNYTVTDTTGKTTCRSKLLAGLQLAPNPAGPVFAMVTRLAEQKGLDLLLPLLDRLLADDVRLIILGEGESRYERELQIASRKHATRFAYRSGWDDNLAHTIEAGADFSLIPSHFEPCGLSAMYSLKYGTLPIARACGGLHQIIQDFDPTSGAGNGFLFYHYTSEALWDAIGRARRVTGSAAVRASMIKAAMESDFSWNTAAEEYEKLYARLK